MSRSFKNVGSSLVNFNISIVAHKNKAKHPLEELALYFLIRNGFQENPWTGQGEEKNW